jgi:hypothetical protein
MLLEPAKAATGAAQHSIHSRRDTAQQKLPSLLTENTAPMARKTSPDTENRAPPINL